MPPKGHAILSASKNDIIAIIGKGHEKYNINENNAFNSLTIQKRVDISSVQTLSGRAFGTTSFPANTYLYLPNLKTIGTYSFSSAKNIVYVHAPVLKYIGYATFSGVTSLKSIQLDSLEYFQNHSSGTEFTFKGCSSLETIIIGDKLTNWGKTALSGAGANTNLKVILMAPDPTKISGTIGLPANATLTVPRDYLPAYEAYFAAYPSTPLWGNVTSDNLATIQFLLSDQVQVGENSFVTVTYLAELLYGNKIEIVDISIMPGDAVIDGNFSFPSTLTSDDQLTVYTVVSIAGKAMSRLPAPVTSITLPATLEFVNFSGLDTPAGLLAYSIADTNTIYQTTDGILYTKQSEMLVLYPNGKDAVDFVLPQSVQYIGAYAFAGNQTITSLTLSGNLVFSDGVFKECVTLTQIELNGNPVFIGRDTISGCHPDLSITVNGSHIVLYDSELRDKINFYATFCMGNCQNGISVSIDDQVYSVTPETAQHFFEQEVLGRIEK